MTTASPTASEGRSEQPGTLASDAIWLYVIQALTYLLPLLIIQRVSRVLGPSEWGRLAIAEALGRYVQLVVEYGLQMSGAREVSAHIADAARRGEALANVVASQLLLSVVSAPLGVLVATALGIGKLSSAMMGCAVLWGVGQGMSLVWYFQATRDVRRYALLEMFSRGLSLACIFWLVSRPEQSFLVLGVQAATCFLSVGVGLCFALQNTPLVIPGWRQVLTTLRLGLSLFGFRAAMTLYTSLNVILLSLYVTNWEVGLFSAAERVSRLVLNGLHPLNQLLYVRIAHLSSTHPDRAEDLARKAVTALAAVGVLCSLVLCLGARLISQALFGERFLSGSGLIRAFAAVTLLGTLNSALGTAWLLPKNQDGVFSLGAVGAGLLNVVLANLLSWRYGAYGMVSSLIVAELFICGLYYAHLKRLRFQHVFADPLIYLRRWRQLLPQPSN